jgi:hypothetical protein
MLMQTDRSQLAELIARAWTDPAFKDRLKADPCSALTEIGMTLPAGVEVEILENTRTKIYLTIPFPHHESEDAILDDDLITAAHPRVDMQTGSTLLSCTRTRRCGC